MSWTYVNWILCNVLIGFGLVLFTSLIVTILLRKFDSIFYGMVAKLFNIKRCVIDVHHTIIRDNSDILTEDNAKSTTRIDFLSNLRSCWTTTTNIKDSIAAHDLANFPGEQAFCKLSHSAGKVVSQTETRDSDEDSIEDNEQIIPVTSLPSSANTDVNKQTISTKLTSIRRLSTSHPSHRAFERIVLNVYGKYLTLDKKRNKLLIASLSIIVISAVLLAGFEGCILATSSIYQGGQCPVYGSTECFHGNNRTFFECKSGVQVNISLLGGSASCFRWIVRDASVSNVITQIGVCTGLLTALGSITEVFIRLLLVIFQQRRGIATGIRRIMEKTVGINHITQPTRCCGIKLPFHFHFFTLSLFEHPYLIILIILFYIFLPVVVVAAFILLSYFQISITSLTYIVLLTLALLCSFSLIWIVWESDEIGRVIPGGWMDIQELMSSVQLKKIIPLSKGITSPQNVNNFIDSKKMKIQTLSSNVKNRFHKIEAPVQKVLVNNQNTERESVSTHKRHTKIKISKSLSRKKLAALIQLTDFHEKDILAWHIGFHHDCPDGFLDKEIFLHIFKKYYIDDHRAESFWEYMCGMFDDNNDHKISFEEFLIAIASKTQGSVNLRLTLAFHMYDVQDTGQLDLAELTNLIVAMYDLVHETNRTGEHDPKSRAMQIINKLDEDNDQKLSKDEFLKAWDNIPQLRNLLIPMSE